MRKLHTKHLSEKYVPTTDICAQPGVSTRVGGYMRGAGRSGRKTLNVRHLTLVFSCPSPVNSLGARQHLAYGTRATALDVLSNGAVGSRPVSSHGRAVADLLLAARGRLAPAALAEAVATTDGGPPFAAGPRRCLTTCLLRRGKLCWSL
jgi:hypothetical protein